LSVVLPNRRPGNRRIDIAGRQFDPGRQVRLSGPPAATSLSELP
jgi:hypothetical protein